MGKWRKSNADYQHFHTVFKRFLSQGPEKSRLFGFEIKKEGGFSICLIIKLIIPGSVSTGSAASDIQVPGYGKTHAQVSTYLPTLH